MYLRKYLIRIVVTTLYPSESFIIHNSSHFLTTISQPLKSWTLLLQIQHPAKMPKAPSQLKSHFIDNWYGTNIFIWIIDDKIAQEVVGMVWRRVNISKQRDWLAITYSEYWLFNNITDNTITIIFLVQHLAKVFLKNQLLGSIFPEFVISHRITSPCLVCFG